MTLTAMLAALKIELADPGWDDNELTRSISIAVTDLSRYLPDESVYETTIVLDVSDEPWTSGAAHGTYVSLANKPIKYQSEKVTSADGATTYTRDTDYTMDYVNGKITTISGGSMVINTAYLISYSKSRYCLDITSLLTNLITIRRVEYPLVATGPQEMIPFNLWGNLLFFGVYTPEKSSELSENKHFLIYYDAECTAPTALASGSFARYLDQIVLKGAAAYSVMSRSIGQSHSAKTNYAEGIAVLTSITNKDAETALSSVGARITAATTALAKITSQATLMDTALGNIIAHGGQAAVALDKVATHVGEAGTALAAVAADGGPLSKVNTALGNMATPLSNANTALSAIALAGGPLAKVNTALEAAVAQAVKAVTTIGNIDGLITGATATIDHIDGVITDGETALGKVTTQIASMATALGEIAAIWTDEDTYRGYGHGYLTSGDDHINKINVGDRVAEMYYNYANVEAVLSRLSESVRTAKLGEASSYLNSANSLIAEANSRMGLINGWVGKARSIADQITGRISETNGRITIANGYIAEAVNRLATADKYIAEAQGRLAVSDRYATEANARLATADKYIAEASGRIAMATAYITEAQGRIAVVDRYIAEANARISLIVSYINEAGVNLGQANAYIAQAQGHVASNELLVRKADGHIATANNQIVLSERYMNDAIERRNEFWSILRDRSQHRNDVSLIPQRQLA